MLYKQSTEELMAQFNNALASISGLKDTITAAKDSISNRMHILDIQHEYLLQSAEILKDVNNTTTNKIVFAETNILDGIYDSFGITIHPKLKKTPSNILNFKTTTGFLFKNNVKTSITLNNDSTTTVEDIDYLNVLKHDSIETKDYFIKEYDTPNVTLTITADDVKTLGNINFNVIEFLPYLSGSFDANVYIFERGATVPSYVQKIYSIAPSRIILPEKMALSKIELHFKLNFKTHNKYPLGLKHLYLLNASFDEDNSYIVVKNTQPKSINYIYDDILFKTQEGVYEGFTLNYFNIEVYANYDYENNVLSLALEPSTKNNPRYISMNLNTVYFKIPITTGTIAFVPTIVSE